MPYIEFGTPNMARTRNKFPNFALNFTGGKKPLFSDNARVLQKPNVNYGGSVGTVSNSRRKSRYT